MGDLDFAVARKYVTVVNIADASDLFGSVRPCAAYGRHEQQQDRGVTQDEEPAGDGRAVAHQSRSTVRMQLSTVKAPK